MRGLDQQSSSLFSYVNLEERIPATHELRTIGSIVNTALAALDGEFAVLYSTEGRPSIPPERLLRGHVDPNAVLGPLGPPAHGADALQSLVSLVRRAWH